MRDYFFLPEGLNLIELMKHNGMGHLATRTFTAKCHFIVDYVYVQNHILKKAGKFDDGYVPVCYQVLREVIGPHYAARAKRVLTALGILQEKPGRDGKENYCAARHESKRYKLAPEYAQMAFRRVSHFGGRLQSRILANRARRNSEAIAAHAGRSLIQRSIESLSFDAEGAKAFVEAAPYDSECKRNARYMIIELLKSREYLYSEDKAGRFYHLLTMCPQDVRRFLSWCGEPLWSVDVSQCQPALHASLYSGESEERSRFIDLVSKGKLYVYLNSQLSCPVDLENPKQKRQFKENIFACTFYSCPFKEQRDEIAKVFQKSFPLLTDAINKTKRSIGWKKLPVEFQRLEADIVINSVAKRLAEAHSGQSYCLISIHDCLITTESHVQEVCVVLCDEFRKRLGFKVSVKTSCLGLAPLPIAS
jgi:hypothetical protein